MNKRRILTALTTVVILIFLYGGSAIASNLYVDDDDPTCGGNSPCYSTIQTAINAASAGDTVLVADGTYTGAGNKYLDFLGKAITVQSENGPNNCIIDIEGSGQGFVFWRGEGNNSVVSGFTITNSETYQNEAIHISDSSPTIENCVITGNGSSGIYCGNANPIITNCTITGNTAQYGSGIWCDANSSPTITDCTITGNTAEYGSGIQCSDATITNSIISGNTTTAWGGAVYCDYGIITGCTIADNNGGGIYCVAPTITDCTITGNSQRGIIIGGNAIITGCTISGNTTEWGGGGINIGEDSSPTITNSIISNNTADLDGGGIRCLGNSSPIITNCSISNNTASQDGGGIYCRDDPSPTVTNSILWGDSPDEIYIAGGVITVTYSDIEGAWVGIGNIAADPLFVGGGDYHLKDYSSCIGAGTPVGAPGTDIDGNPRPNPPGSDPDMGAYENSRADPASTPNGGDGGGGGCFIAIAAR